jgi:hypothetical protein
MNREPDSVDRADVESLQAMSSVHLAAQGAPGRSGTPEPTPPPLVPTGPVPCQADASRVADDAVRVRELLGQQNVVGPTRFALPKRLVLRASQVFTHRLVAASHALADEVETLARVQVEAFDVMTRARAQTSNGWGTRCARLS